MVGPHAANEVSLVKNTERRLPAFVGKEGEQDSPNDSEREFDGGHGFLLAFSPSSADRPRDR